NGSSGQQSHASAICPCLNALPTNQVEITLLLSCPRGTRPYENRMKSARTPSGSSRLLQQNSQTADYRCEKSTPAEPTIGILTTMAKTTAAKMRLPVFFIPNPSLPRSAIIGV